VLSFGVTLCTSIQQRMGVCWRKSLNSVALSPDVDVTRIRISCFVMAHCSSLHTKSAVLEGGRGRGRGGRWEGGEREAGGREGGRDKSKQPQSPCSRPSALPAPTPALPNGTLTPPNRRHQTGAFLPHTRPHAASRLSCCRRAGRCGGQDALAPAGGLHVRRLQEGGRPGCTSNTHTTHIYTHTVAHANTHTYTHIHTHTRARTDVYTRTHETHSCSHSDTHASSHTQTHACSHSHMHTYTHSLSHAHIHTHSLTCTHTHTLSHMHTHAYTHTLSLSCTHTHSHASLHVRAYSHRLHVRASVTWSCQMFQEYARSYATTQEHDRRQALFEAKCVGRHSASID